MKTRVSLKYFVSYCSSPQHLLKLIPGCSICQTMDIVQSNRFYLKKLSQYKILEKVAALLFSFML